ncbi:MAG: hypothetical protein ACI837_003102 [Crocinitomicaceae bacterium]|jgi:hypothetical protein
MKYLFTVILTLSVNCSFSQLTGNGGDPTSIILAEDIKCYPNPSSGNASIEFPTLPIELELEVINADGELIRLESLSAGSTKFVLSELESGIYILRIQDVDVQWKEKLFVINK